MNKHLRSKSAIKVAIYDLTRRFFYPGNDGNLRRKDPTYGRVDRDIQWHVNDFYQHISVGQRCAIENTIQNNRNREEGKPLV